MGQNRRQRGWVGLMCLLTACEVVGDMSESVGTMFRQPLRDAGGGPPVLADDGGIAVTWYLNQVMGEELEICQQLSLGQDSMANAIDPEQIQAQYREVETQAQPWLDDMNLGIELKLEDEIAERFDGHSFLLDQCHLKACSLSCETSVKVTKAENENGQAFGNELDIRLPVDGGTMETLCQRHDKDGSTSRPIDAHHVNWTHRVRDLKGEASAGRLRQMSLDSYIVGETEGESRAVQVGDELILRVDSIESCLEQDGAAIRYQKVAGPKISNWKAGCAAEGAKQGTAGSLLISAQLQGSHGPVGVGMGPTAELLITGHDENRFIGHFDVVFRCNLPSGRSLKPQELEDYLSSRMAAEEWARIQDDKRMVLATYDKLRQADPMESMTCSAVLAKENLGDMDCVQEEASRWQYELIVQDQSGRWSGSRQGYFEADWNPSSDESP